MTSLLNCFLIDNMYSYEHATLMRLQLLKADAFESTGGGSFLRVLALALEFLLRDRSS